MRIYSKDEAKSEITRLVDAFGENIDFYKSDKYKEANLEDEYLKPFLRYLNWNISNEGITNIANREVIVQAKGKRGKEPDYLLQLEGKPKFYIEAKHPKYKLSKDIGYIWQAYSYAYSTQASTERKKVDFSLLTDFEEFRFFDCTFAASKQTVNNFVTIDWKFKDYETEFDNLWSYFEKENIRKGSLKSLYLNEKKVKENRIPPDKAFLNDLDNEKTGWRIQIAKEIKKYNPGFSAEYITRAVQLIIDRFIFIKVLSDREIEDDYLSEIIINIDKALLKSEDGILIDSCKEVFAKLNRVYNGSIFAPKPELESIHISNKVLKNVLSDLLPENSRYNFKQLPVEVLGTIYEQFLGKVIETTEKRVSVEYKPEVRKAGGVYYTPQYIVEYIVENTVGEKLKECKSVEDVFAIKICDPACGSGSFLLGAYDRLVRWCTDHYTKTIKPGAAISKKNAEHVYIDEDGQLRLTSKLRRELLKNCIFGVDIDNQAVEVAITSLSLKALEGTRHDELYAEVDLFHETVLPKLEDNIKCGNSLIGMDIFDGKLEFSKDEEKKLNPFDWERNFPGVFGRLGTADKTGHSATDRSSSDLQSKSYRDDRSGFDCVIGNPPYGNIFNEYLMLYYKKKYLNTEGRFENYELFIENGLALLNNSEALFSYIIPNTLLTNLYSGKLRNWLQKKFNIIKVVNFKMDVFADPTVHTMILVLKKTLRPFFDTKIFNNISSVVELGKDIYFSLNQTSLSDKENGPWDIFITPDKRIIIEKMNVTAMPLTDVCWIRQCIKTGDDKKYVIRSEIEMDEPWKPSLQGKSINRYSTFEKNIYIKYGNWLARNWQNKSFYETPKICVRETSPRITATLDLENRYLLSSLYSVYPRDNFNHFSLNYLLGIINSTLAQFFIKLIAFDSTEGAFTKIRTNQFGRLPIHILDHSNSLDMQKHDQLVTLVDTMLSLHKELHQPDAPLTEQQQNQLKDRIAYTDRQIDQLVYQLYGLTEEEIAIVEGEC